MTNENGEKDYKDLYQRAILHIKHLEIALDNQIEITKFYRTEAEIFEKKWKEKFMEGV